MVVLEEEVASVQTRKPQHLIPAGAMVGAGVAVVQQMVLVWLLCQQLVIQFRVEGAMYVVILHILQITAPIAVTEALSQELHPSVI